MKTILFQFNRKRGKRRNERIGGYISLEKSHCRNCILVERVRSAFAVALEVQWAVWITGVPGTQKKEREESKPVRVPIKRCNASLKRRRSAREWSGEDERRKDFSSPHFSSLSSQLLFLSLSRVRPGRASWRTNIANNGAIKTEKYLREAKDGWGSEHDNENELWNEVFIELLFEVSILSTSIPQYLIQQCNIYTADIYTCIGIVKMKNECNT